MARDSDGHAGAVLMAFVLGALSGAAVALLWTPSTGEETRHLLNDKARDGRDRATHAAQQGREFMDRQRGTVATAISRGREAYERRSKADKTNEAPA